MDILSFYKGMLSAAGIAVDDNGYCFNTVAGLNQPVTLSGKKLVLPTPEILDSNQWDKVVGFHPTSESVIRGESPVLRKLRKGFQNRLNYIIMKIFEHAVSIAANTAEHEKLSPAQTALIRVLSQADETTLKNIGRVNDAVELESTDNKFVNIYIKKEGMVGGKAFKRAAIVTFPFYQCMETTEPRIFGVTVRQKDKKAFVAFMDYLLPKSNEAGTYDAGSHDLNMPALDSLLAAVGEMFIKLNDFVLLYQNLLPDAEALVTNLDWYDGVEQMDKYRTLIPALDGNQGISHRAEQDAKVATNNNAFALTDRETTTNRNPASSSATTTATTSANSNAVPYHEYIAKRNAELNVAPPPGAYPPPGAFPPPMPPGYGYGYNAPAVPNGYQPPPPAGYQPVYQPGYQPGYQAGYQPPQYQQYSGGAGMSPGRAAAAAPVYNPYGNTNYQRF